MSAQQLALYRIHKLCPSRNQCYLDAESCTALLLLGQASLTFAYDLPDASMVCIEMVASHAPARIFAVLLAIPKASAAKIAIQAARMLAFQALRTLITSPRRTLHGVHWLPPCSCQMFLSSLLHAHKKRWIARHGSLGWRNIHPPVYS